MGRNSRRIKERAEELRDGYQEAAEYDFSESFYEFIKHNEGKVITEEDVIEFMEGYNFPDEDTWVFTEVDNELAEIGDAKMEEARDREMGL